MQGFKGKGSRKAMKERAKSAKVFLKDFAPFLISSSALCELFVARFA